jgi:hypothetical protein
MTKLFFQKLKKHFAVVAGCRECELPTGCFSKLRPSGPGYHLGGVVFLHINFYAYRKPDNATDQQEVQIRIWPKNCPDESEGCKDPKQTSENLYQ